MVFGYKNGAQSRIEQEIDSPIEEDHDYYANEQKKRIIDFYKSLRKDYKINLLNEFIDPLDKIDEVVVLGHSMNRVHQPYFDLIEKRIHPSKWIIFYHDDEVEKNVEFYSFCSKVNFIHW